MVLVILRMLRGLRNLGALVVVTVHLLRTGILLVLRMLCRLGALAGIQSVEAEATLLAGAWVGLLVVIVWGRLCNRQDNMQVLAGDLEQCCRDVMGQLSLDELLCLGGRSS